MFDHSPPPTTLNPCISLSTTKAKSGYSSKKNLTRLVTVIRRGGLKTLLPVFIRHRLSFADFQ